MTEAEAQAVLAAEPAQFARRTLISLGLDSSPLTPAHGNSSNVWLTPTHALRISSGRFVDAYAHERAVLELLPPDVPHARPVAYGRAGTREWMVQERVAGVPLARAWPHLSQSQRRAAVRQIGQALRALHATQTPAGFYNPWLDDALAPNGHPENAYHAPPAQAHLLLAAVQQLDGVDEGLLREVGAFIAERLDAFADDHAVLTHGDVHWANLMWHEQTLTAVLDFEGARLAAPDQELDTLLRFVRTPTVYSGQEGDTPITPADLRAVPAWIAEVYPELLAHPRLGARLEVYEALWHLVQVFHFAPGSGVRDPWPHLRTLIDADNRWTRLG